MKKIFLFLVASLIIILAACNSTEEKETYTITWEVEGKIVETDENVEAGTMPHYDGATPTKDATAEYTYSFKEWSPALYVVDKDQKYVAVFTETEIVDEKEEYTVSFDSQGGSAIASQKVEEGKLAVKPTNPTLSGHVFKYWSTSKNGNEYNFSTPITANITLYAVWEEEEAKPAKLQAPVLVLENGVLSWEEIPNATDYLFYAKYVELNDEQEGLLSELGISSNEIQISSIVGDLEGNFIFKLKAIGDGELYLDSDFSNEITYIQEAIEPQPTKLARPTIELDGKVISWSEEPNASLYELHIGDEVLDIKTNEYDLTNILAELPEADEYEIYVIAKGNGELYLDSDPSITLIYNVQKYEVKFNVLEGSEPIESQIVNEYKLAEEPKAPELEGYSFVCWCIDSELLEAFDFETPITKNITLYPKYNQTIDVVGYLKSLTGMMKVNPYSYIPETMQPGYEPNLVKLADVEYDFSDFVNISDINYGGFGEQWNMVISNINQSQVFFNVLTTIDSVTSASIVAFQNYIDSNPADSNNYEFKYGTYDVTIKYENDTLFYVLGFTTDIPLLGEQTIEIMNIYNVLNKEVTGRIQIGDANAIAYTIGQNSFTFGYKYLGVGTAYFEISIDEYSNISGHIYEFLSAGDIDTIISSCADFYTIDDRLYTVGNKASGMIAFTGTIVEMYDITTGKLMSYEVNESLSKINYDTLWFNLSDIEGIDNIKVIEGSSDENKSNPHTVYINNSSEQFKVKNVGGISAQMLSRRYDIEMRTQYFYYLNEEDEYEAIEVQIPMLFVQEAQYEDLISDVEEENDITISLSTNITLNVEDLISNYDILVPIFNENKENVTAEAIEEFIGQKYSDMFA